MSKTFNNLSNDDKNLILEVYKKSNTRKEAQNTLSERFGVTKRCIRKWAKNLFIGVLPENISDIGDIMVYDIETSRGEFKLWWSGKQFVNGNSMIKEPKIISICWKWLGKDKVHTLTCDKNHCDKAMLESFLKEYNKADLVIGQNNDKFDNRWLNTRASKFELDINTMVNSFDIMKQNKRLFRLPSYSMKFLCKYYDVPQKLEHEGIKMWDMIEDGNKNEQKEYLKKMVDYNIGDIISTEALYYRLRKYYNHKIHLGVKNGEAKWTCPLNGSTDVSLYKTKVTPAGTIQRIMVSNSTGSLYKISNKSYMDFIDWKIKN
jgi:hypothetical protein